MTKYQLEVKARISVMYHRRRQAFLERWDFAAKILALVTSAAVIYGEKYGAHQLGYWIAVATATITMGVVVGGASRKAVQHSVLAARWATALGDMVGVEENSKALEPIKRRFAEIKRDELPELGALIRLCHREVLRADGCKEADLPQVPCHHRLLAQWVDFQTPPAE
ncbi:MAG: hypothetical protein AB7P08_12825 [Burkholderiales bacterium]